LAPVAAAAGLTFTSTAAAASYSFINVADSGQFSNFGSTGVSINNHGTVAFVARTVAGGQGVFTGAGGMITTVVDNSGAFDDFLTFNSFLSASINDNGTVAFRGFHENGFTSTIYTSSVGTVTTIAETISAPFPREVAFPVINSAGVVAFRVFFHELDPLHLNFAIRTGNGGPLTLVADSSGPLSLTNSTSLHMNDNGTVAFAALMDGGGVGIFAGNGGPLSPVVTGATGFTGFSDPSINASGTVAFSSERTNGVRGIFTSDGGPVSTIADSTGPFTTGFGREAIINATGQVAFRATLDVGGQGIFTGPDPVANKVIQTGDQLFSSTVTMVGLSNFSQDGTFDINDNGDVAFHYTLADGTFGIAVARVVPEPSSALSLAIGLLGVRETRRRRPDSAAKT
jgi:hypothetical protein